jgi:hypothetical protein
MDIKRCVFCGRQGRVANTLSEWRVLCGSNACAAAGPVRSTYPGAIKAWNRRVATPEKKGPR